MIRFLTETDYPPFNFAGPDGSPQGFNIDLARAMCEELKIACTIQMRRFETLIAALKDNRGDAVIASIAATPEMRQKVDFSDPYTARRRASSPRRDSTIEDPRPGRLEGKKVAVVAGSSHEAYLKALFTELEVPPIPAPMWRALPCGVATSTFSSATASRLRSGSTVPTRELLRVPRRALFRQPLFRRGTGIAVRRGNDRCVSC